MGSWAKLKHEDAKTLGLDIQSWEIVLINYKAAPVTVDSFYFNAHEFFSREDLDVMPWFDVWLFFDEDQGQSKPGTAPYKTCDQWVEFLDAGESFNGYELELVQSTWIEAFEAGRKSVSQPDTVAVDECPECRSTDLSWHTQSSARSSAPDGRLRANEVSTLFVLGCNHCSETIETLAADEVAGRMTARALLDQERGPINGK